MALNTSRLRGLYTALVSSLHAHAYYIFVRHKVLGRDTANKSTNMMRMHAIVCHKVLGWDRADTARDYGIFEAPSP